MRRLTLRVALGVGASILIGAVLGCTPSEILVRSTPSDALTEATRRLEERGIQLDPAGRKPDRLRSAYYCYRPPGPEGPNWDASFVRTSQGPVPVEHIAPPSEQRPEVTGCMDLFRFTVLAAPNDSGHTRVVVRSEWWRAAAGRCVTVGDPLVGESRCVYRYRGSTPPDNVERFVYSLLSGI